jgi:hypothetical protein
MMKKEMFYAERMSNALRFGDILRGYFSTTPVIEEPLLEQQNKKYKIDVDLPQFSVVMDPCCQIGNGTISLTPLTPVKSSFFDNPYLAEDLTRVNCKMKSEQAIPPKAWEQMSPEERQKRQEEGFVYAFAGLFVYDKHDLLPRYPIHGKDPPQETNYYMISFKDTFKLGCEKIKSPEKAPLESKVLELSIETRNELRAKLVSYYAAVPKEDKAVED